jgi:DeoR/GlpR family transcriptional regulator of sugar metabolism
LTSIISGAEVQGSMRVPLHLVQERRQRLADLLETHSYLPVQEVCRHLRISEATARRDLAALEKEQRIIRTFGGALSEFNRRFASFHERLERGESAKERIAAAAAALIRPGTTCFFDTGTTVYALAERLAAGPVGPLRVVTNSLPVAEKLGGVGELTVFLLGGEYLPRQSALMGGKARRALALHAIDLAFLSAEGADAAGVWNSQQDIVEFQRALIARSARHALCLDRSKFGRPAANFLIPWDEVGLLISDIRPGDLQGVGIRLPPDRFVQA